ncbi:uncharacterized protein Dvar_08070 [Desulfosarcina variabilis str. Montpellier]|uniref:hypothetical protein n=1 Tax=Desulfosarcina variabilis TaxID=2300 RepID=UPI003AFA6061
MYDLFIEKIKEIDHFLSNMQESDDKKVMIDRVKNLKAAMHNLFEQADDLQGFLKEFSIKVSTEEDRKFLNGSIDMLYDLKVLSSGLVGMEQVLMSSGMYRGHDSQM